MCLSHDLSGVWRRRPFAMAEHSPEPQLSGSVCGARKGRLVLGLERWLSEHLAPGPSCADRVANPGGLVRPWRLQNPSDPRPSPWTSILGAPAENVVLLIASPAQRIFPPQGQSTNARVVLCSAHGIFTSEVLPIAVPLSLFCLSCVSGILWLPTAHAHGWAMAGPRQRLEPRPLGPGPPSPARPVLPPGGQSSAGSSGGHHGFPGGVAGDGQHSFPFPTSGRAKQPLSTPH